MFRRLPLLHSPDDAQGGMSPGAAPVALDEAALATLRQLDPDGRKGLVTRVLSTFETSLDRLRADLMTARSAGDRVALGRAAHTLKSSSAAVGALDLSVACKSVETFLREGQTGDLESLLDALMRQIEGAARAVRARLGASGPAA